MKTKSRPVTLYLLIICLIVLSLGAFVGGVGMLIDPAQGLYLQLPPELLDGLPIDNFLVPGLFLTIVFGIAPLLVAAGLWRRAPWARLAASLLGLTLIGWIAGQIFLWGAPEAIQYFCLVLGFLILIFSLAVPSLKEDQAAAIPRIAG